MSEVAKQQMTTKEKLEVIAKRFLTEAGVDDRLLGTNDVETLVTNLTLSETNDGNINEDNTIRVASKRLLFKRLVSRSFSSDGARLARLSSFGRTSTRASTERQMLYRQGRIHTGKKRMILLLAAYF